MPEGTTVAFDGGTGRLVVDPDPATLAEFATHAAEQHDHRLAEAAAARRPADTRDGVTIEVAANVGGIADAIDAMENGADLAGLVRTEFLFLDHDHAPSVAEQERVYRAIAEAFDGRRIALRTLDAGGDKPLPYIAQPAEANPFLGVRGIRLVPGHPDLLRDQLRAARVMLADIAPEDLPIEVGIMVEVPATAAKVTDTGGPGQPAVYLNGSCATSGTGGRWSTSSVPVGGPSPMTSGPRQVEGVGGLLLRGLPPGYHLDVVRVGARDEVHVTRLQVPGVDGAVGIQHRHAGVAFVDIAHLGGDRMPMWFTHPVLADTHGRGLGIQAEPALLEDFAGQQQDSEDAGRDHEPIVARGAAVVVDGCGDDDRDHQKQKALHTGPLSLISTIGTVASVAPHGNR